MLRLSGSLLEGWRRVAEAAWGLDWGGGAGQLAHIREEAVRFKELAEVGGVVRVLGFLLGVLGL